MNKYDNTIGILLDDITEKYKNKMINNYGQEYATEINLNNILSSNIIQYINISYESHKLKNENKYEIFFCLNFNNTYNYDQEGIEFKILYLKSYYKKLNELTKSLDKYKRILL